MKKHIFVILGLSFVFAACGKNDSQPQTTSGNAVVSGPSTSQYPNQYFSPISNDWGGFYVSYKFVQNSCSTGFHEFYSQSDAETRNRLCTTLQDNWRNRGCAMEIRQAYFNSMCSGRTWAPF